MKPLKLAAIAGVFVLGFGIAWRVYRPAPAKPEPPAPAVRQSDGSLMLERAPSGVSSTADPRTPPLKISQKIPAGATVEREIEIRVAPNPLAGSPQMTQARVGGSRATSRTPETTVIDPVASLNSLCPALTIDLALIRLKDQTRRVIASSPDGSIVGGLDVPIETPAPFKIPRWSAAALAGYDTHAGRKVFGGSVSYGRGPFVVQGGVVGGTAFVGAGVRF